MASRLIPILLLCSVIGTAFGKTRIVGGQETSIERYPSIVQVDFYSIWTATWSQSCAGNIINSIFVLCAAHCFEGTLALAIYRRIRAGSTDRNTGGVVHDVDSVLNHPAYGIAARYDADINLVRLRTPLVYTPVVQRVTIISHNSGIPDNSAVTHAGWGTTSSGGQASPILRDVVIYVINNQLCADRYAQLFPNSVYRVTRNMICAGLLDIGGRDACQGDSGGPLYYGTLLVGIVSWGHGCANATFPGVSTSVSAYTNWIVSNAN
ncbi:unnamed protein product [Leptidea sinapis]|uniref:Peptidase S1 domain-containing protein n=1 Tax=Leptidea sinapis TaxID=189913 RepID=A0A5E4QMM5_9NEOP|nr:unnamed protein product [Leptidea sinapis]